MQQSPEGRAENVLLAAWAHPAFARRVRAVSKAEDRSVSATIRQALRAYVEDRREVLNPEQKRACQ